MLLELSKHENQSMPRVLISGATGFIAQHIIHQFLEKGYNVIGTVRTKEKAANLSDLFRNKQLSFEIVSDLSNPDAFEQVFAKYGKEIKYVIHTASPCHYYSSDYENDMLLPAINGTKSLMNAIKKYGSVSVEHVVFTSSFAAISNVSNAYDERLSLNEESWNNDSWDEAKKNAKTAYYGSKAFAEKAAWQFLKNNVDKVNFKLTAVNPCYVFGPQLFDESISRSLNASCQIINEIVYSRSGNKVEQQFASFFIDVRDVAKAHILAVEKPVLAGRRLILANTKFALQDIVDIINKNFPELRGEITEGFVGNGAEVVKHIASIDNSKTKEMLELNFRSFEETICETVSQIIRVKEYKHF